MVVLRPTSRLERTNVPGLSPAKAVTPRPRADSGGPPRRRQTPPPREIPMTQAILLHTLAVHAVTAAGHLSAARPWHVLAVDVPNPPPAAPPGLAGPMNTILG